MYETFYNQRKFILNLTCVKTEDAVDHDKQGTSTKGIGQFVAANEAMCPPIDNPVTPNGPKPIFSHQCNNTKFSRTRHPPITNISDTLFKFDRLVCQKKICMKRFEHIV